MKLVLGSALGLLAVLCLSLPLYSADQKIISETAGVPVYNPPVKNAEANRRIAGEAEKTNQETAKSRGITRGVTRAMTLAMTRKASGDSRGEQEILLPSRMSPIAPEHTGLTSSPQPVLLWYISGPWPDKIEFRLNEIGVAEPLADTDITGPGKEGFCRINLADYKISLKPGAEYEWFLTIVFDKDERSADFTASAAIRYVKPSDELSKRLSDTPKEKQYGVYAGQGYWYDAIDSLSRLIDAKPEDKILIAHRASLLNQVKLSAEAAYDTREAGKQ